MTRMAARIVVLMLVLEACGSLGVQAECLQAASGYPSTFYHFYPMDGGPADLITGAAGAPFGGPVFVIDPGTGFGSVVLGGVFDYLALPLAATTVDGMSQFTIEAWVKRSGSGTSDTIYYEGAGGIATLALVILGDGRLELTIRSVLAPEAASPTVFTSDQRVTTGNWTHVAATVDLVRKEYRLYIDGLPVTSAGVDHTTALLFASAPTDVNIGMGDAATLTDPFAGSIDELTTYRRPLSPCELADIARFGREGKCKADADFDFVIDPLDNCPTVVNPAQADGDGDGAGDVCDALPGLSDCFAVPEFALHFISNQLTLCSLRYWAGIDQVVYDVVEGQYPPIVPVGSSPTEVCLANDAVLGGEDTIVTTAPSVGRSLWFLARGRNVCGQGNYGFASSGAPRTTTVCN